MENTGEILLDYGQTSAKFRVARRTIMRWVADSARTGFPRPLRPMGGRALFRLVELDNWIATRAARS